MEENAERHDVRVEPNSSDEGNPGPAPDRPERWWHPCKRWVSNNVITVASISGILVGIVLGVILKAVKNNWTLREKMYLNFPGELFINMLKCIVVPLMVSSTITAIGRLDTHLACKIGWRAVAYYALTTVVAALIGVALVMAIQPGHIGDDAAKEPHKIEPPDKSMADTWMDLFRNIITSNFIESFTMQKLSTFGDAKNVTGGTEADKGWKLTTTSGTNVLGIISVSIVFGVILSRMGDAGKPILVLSSCVVDALFVATRYVKHVAPVGLVFLVSSEVVGISDYGESFSRVGAYMGTVFFGLVLQGLVILPLTYVCVLRRNPFAFMAKLSPPLINAFGTASSLATLPVTIECVEAIGVDRRVSRMCLPLGVTLNMNGTAVYEGVAILFVAQMYDRVTLNLVASVSVMVIAASVATAGIPQAGLTNAVMVLSMVGIPIPKVAYVLMVDWIVDRFRTMVNVLGNAFAAVIVEHLCRNDLLEHPMEEPEADSTSA